ncbi:MAG: hypothetical protein WBW00_20760, partial [Pseudolabrys sp.]
PARWSGSEVFWRIKKLNEGGHRNFMIKIGRSIPEDSLPDVSTVPVPPGEKSKDELLLELGDLVTLDHLDKELEVENKLMAKLDRLFKRFFQIKAMKPLIGLGEPLAPALASTKPVLELAATVKSSGRAWPHNRV